MTKRTSDSQGRQNGKGRHLHRGLSLAARKTNNGLDVVRHAAFALLALLAVITALITALAGISCLGTRSPSVPTDPGISDDQVLFGQSAVFRGPYKELGRQMRLGIQAAFYEVNQAGGVHGRQLKLETIDDSSEPDTAFHTNE